MDSRFQVDQVLLDTGTDPAKIQILFRWAGETTLFGLSYQIDQDDEHPPGVTTPSEFAIMTAIAVEEDLLAKGYGVQNAIREPKGDVTWLRWTTPGTR